jgi:hypothetical protein
VLELIAGEAPSREGLPEASLVVRETTRPLR